MWEKFAFEDMYGEEAMAARVAPAVGRRGGARSCSRAAGGAAERGRTRRGVTAVTPSGLKIEMRLRAWACEHGAGRSTDVAEPEMKTLKVKTHESGERAHRPPHHPTDKGAPHPTAKRRRNPRPHRSVRTAGNRHRAQPQVIAQFLHARVRGSAERGGWTVRPRRARVAPPSARESRERVTALSRSSAQN